MGKVLQALTLRPTDNGWTGEMPGDLWGLVVFGGFVIAHAVLAATRDAPAGRRMHSLHAYFLKPVMGGKSIAYRVRTLREGRAFTSRLVEGSQEGQLVLSMMCSFTADTDGYEYQPSRVPLAPGPDDVLTETFGPWLCAVVGPSARDENGHYVSTHRMWFRTASPLPKDDHLACVFTAFATDMTWKGARPLHLDGDTRGIVSLDHAVWFHRPMRPDDWCYYDVTSVINAAGRGLVRGQMFSRDGLLCASVAQETLVTPYKDEYSP